jgi:hypothetical protein
MPRVSNATKEFQERLVRLEARVDMVLERVRGLEDRERVRSVAVPPQGEVPSIVALDQMEAQMKESLKGLTEQLGRLGGLDPDELMPLDFNFNGQLMEDDVETVSVEQPEEV